MKQVVQLTIKGIFLTLVVIASGLGATNAYAASGGLTVSPTSLDTEIAPGASYKGEMLVLNQGEVDYQYKVYATPYSVTGEEYKPYFTAIDGAADITKWITFGSEGDLLKTGGEDRIPFTITVPKGTGAGSYYAALFAETSDKGEAGVITHKRVGMVVYLRVSGDAKEQGSVTAWGVPWLQEAPFGATVKVANEGSVHFQSKVNVKISDLFGSQKYAYERDPQIIPQKIRNIPVSWENGATFGLFKVEGTVSYLGKTETLPTRFVLIASMPIRLLMMAIVVAFVGVMVFLGRKRVAPKK
jgi:hypothetical protein